MGWIIAAAQQTSTSSTPVWLAPLLGGVGALVGGSLTSTVAWRVLSDTKKARQRAEEKETTEIITAALLEVRQIYRNTDVGSGPVPGEFEYWPDYLLSKLDKSEAAVMRFHSEALRKRVTSSLDLLIWGAHDSQLLYETRSSARAVAFGENSSFRYPRRAAQLPPMFVAAPVAMEAAEIPEGRTERYAEPS
ncbi:hypothetical protein [Streptomyces sp. NPDC003996]